MDFVSADGLFIISSVFRNIPHIQSIIIYALQLSIEPISGTAMDLKLRVQLNGVILNTSLSSDHQQHLNVSYMNKLIPVSWSETAASIDAETAKEYSSKVNILSLDTLMV